MAAAKKTAPATSGKTYKTVKTLTVPLLKLQVEVPAHIKILDKMFIGKAQKPAPGKTSMEPATLVNVVDLDTGEARQMILNEALKSILNEAYANDKYVGRAFRVIKHEKVEGKKYFGFTVEEIEA